MTINGATSIIGIFGFPVKHSLSPAMHNAAFEKLGINYAYVPFEVDPKNLKNAVNALRILGISGVNVTIPHKENVVPFLDGIGSFVKQIGCVNTIVNSNGKLTGYNTDAPGFLRDLNDKKFDPAGKTVLLFGAGGAGKAVAAALSMTGAKKIFIIDSSDQKAHILSKNIPKCEFIPFSGWQKKIDKCALFVNATPLGMQPGKPPVMAKDIRKFSFVYDLVYNRTTELSKECSIINVKYANGLGMLLNQGIIAFEYFTGKNAPINVMRKALNNQLSKIYF